MDDYSTDATQMQTTTDPGEVGTESLATTLAGELERIRFILKELGGGAQWYTTASFNLTTVDKLIAETESTIIAERMFI